MSEFRDGRGAVLLVVLLLVLVPGGPAPAQQTGATPGVPLVRGLSARDVALELDDLSPGFLGIYRKVMEIEDEIRAHGERYGVDYDLVRAVCMYESGGNANLTSWAGAEGYFQVMPATYRMLRVDSNIEAGIKYLAQLVERFEREDYALAAYNGGPGTVGRDRPMRLESLQYVLGVGHYRTLLKLYEPSIRRHASTLHLERAASGDDWWSVSRRLGISLLELRLHNPYLGERPLRPGNLVAYPPQSRAGLFESDGEHVRYRTRIGDNYFKVAFAFEVSLDLLRRRNGLWHLQTLPEGIVLELPLDPEAGVDKKDDDYRAIEYREMVVEAGQTIAEVADELGATPWRLIRDNALWDEQLNAGMRVRVRPEIRYLAHTVRAGETLIAIASRYGASVQQIQQANGLGDKTLIRVGQELLIPSQRGR